MATVSLAPATTSSEPQLEQIWRDAVTDIRANLSPSQYQKLQSIDNFDILLSEVQVLNRLHHNRKSSRLFARLDPFFEELHRFSQVINVFIQSNPAVSALVWGSVYTLLEVAARQRTQLQSIVEVFQYIERHLPRIKSFAAIFVVSPRIEKAVCGLYQDLINFCLQASIYLSRNLFVNVCCVTLPLRKRLRVETEFAKILVSIREHTHWIDTEAFVGLHTLTQQLNSRNHEEILSSIAAIPSPQLVTSSTRTTYRMIPHVANPEFFGREHELQTLGNHLLPEFNNSLSIFSLIGPSGVGKSQLALKFAYNHFAEFNAIFWVPADDVVKIDQAYENIAVEVGLISHSGGGGPLDSVREVSKKWFRTTDRNWLIIFDNLEYVTTLADYWPTGSSGAIIVTSQSQNSAQPPISSHCTLNSFSQEEGARFILEHLSQTVRTEDGSADDALQISKACGGLPLALAQVIRYVRSVHVSLSDARKLCCSSEVFVSPVSELNMLDEPDYYHSHNTSMLWEQPLRSLDMPTIRLARLFSYLDPDSVSEQALNLNSCPDIQNYLEVESGVNSSISKLLNRSLILKGSKSGTYSMHRLVQAKIISQINDSQKDALLSLALDVVEDAFPDYDSGNRLIDSWTECGELLPHVVRISQIFSNSKPQGGLVFLKMATLLECGAWYLQERGDRHESGRLLELGLTVAKDGVGLASAQLLESATLSRGEQNAEDTLQELNGTLADITNSLGCLELDSGLFSKALEHYLSALDMKKLIVGEEDDVCDITRNAGIAQLSLNNLEEAHSLLQEAKRLREEQLATVTDRDAFRDMLAFNYGSMSHCLMAMGMLDEAWEEATLSTELCKQIHKPDSVVLSDCYTTLGNISSLQGRLEDAEAFFLEALDIRSQHLGEHELTAISLHKYATALMEKGGRLEAISCLERAVAMLRKIPDAELSLARSLYYLASFKAATGGGQDTTIQDEAATLYWKHKGSQNHGIDNLKSEDFDNLLIHYNR